MFTAKRLSSVLKNSKEITFDDSSKFVLFSDVHRGDNSWADDFAHNQNVFFHALDYYHKNEFTYIELGDGDELWENATFPTIRKAHSHVFWKLHQMYKANRFYMLWGNHNRKWKSVKSVKKYLYKFFDEREKKKKELFDGIVVHEGLKLKHQTTGKTLFLTHGHQGDLLNDQLWWFGRFIVRKIWRPLQLLGVRDPTRPAKNFKSRDRIEKKVIKWSKDKNQIVIIGHTHRPAFPEDNQPPFFNTGSCVHPRSITGFEIENGEIKLIKWLVDVKSNNDGSLYINKEVLAGPRKLSDL